VSVANVRVCVRAFACVDIVLATHHCLACPSLRLSVFTHSLARPHWAQHPVELCGHGHALAHQHSHRAQRASLVPSVCLLVVFAVRTPRTCRHRTLARKLVSSVPHKLLTSTVPPPHPPRPPHRMRLTRSAATFNCVRCRYHGSISRDRAHQLLR
jgi:hypothetical protein